MTDSVYKILLNRVNLVEDNVKAHKSQIDQQNDQFAAKTDSLSNDVKLLLAEINIITKWISSKFGVDLIDTISLSEKIKTQKWMDVEDVTESLKTIEVRIKEETSHENTSSESDSTESDHYNEKQFYIDEEMGFDDDALLSSSSEDEGEGPSDSDDGEVKLPSRNKTSRSISKRQRRSKKDSRKQSCKPMESEPPEKVSKICPPSASPANKRVTRKKQAPKPSSSFQETKKLKDCEICGDAVSEFRYKMHLRDVHNIDRAYKCEICNFSFQNISHYKCHLNTHKPMQTPTKRITYCRFCQWGFYRRDLLDQHLKIHQESQKFLCTFPDCKLSFFSQERYDDHYVIHSDPAPLKCPKCSKGFKTKKNLGDHMRKIHQITLELYLDSISTYDTVISSTLTGSYIVPISEVEVSVNKDDK